jgi:hypothetical protein
LGKLVARGCSEGIGGNKTYLREIASEKEDLSTVVTKNPFDSRILGKSSPKILK